MKQGSLVRNSFQFEITVLLNRSADQTVKPVILHKSADHFLRSEQKLCAIRRMFHRPRFKTVKSLDLLKSANIMQQPNHLRKLYILFIQPHSSADCFGILYYSIGVHDLQMNLIILTVILIQICFKGSFRCIKIIHKFLLSHLSCLSIDN